MRTTTTGPAPARAPVKMSDVRAKLHALVDEIADMLEKGGGDEWVDQNHSPLGKQKHLALAKSGKLPASKDGRQVFVRRSDIDAYLAKKRVVVAIDETADIEAEANKLFAKLNGGRRS